MPIKNANADEIQAIRERLSQRQRSRRCERQMDEAVQMVMQKNKRPVEACKPPRQERKSKTVKVENCSAAISMGTLYVTCAVCRGICRSITGMDMAFLLACGTILVLWGACAL